MEAWNKIFTHPNDMSSGHARVSAFASSIYVTFTIQIEDDFRNVTNGLFFYELNIRGGGYYCIEDVEDKPLKITYKGNEEDYTDAFALQVNRCTNTSVRFLPMPVVTAHRTHHFLCRMAATSLVGQKRRLTPGPNTKNWILIP